MQLNEKDISNEWMAWSRMRHRKFKETTTDGFRELLVEPDQHVLDAGQICTHQDRAVKTSGSLAGTLDKIASDTLTSALILFGESVTHLRILLTAAFHGQKKPALFRCLHGESLTTGFSGLSHS